MFFIYWVKRKSYTDPYHEGYIGFSKDPQRRLQEHASPKNRSRVSASIRKYNDVEMVVLYEFEDAVEALRKERDLRPTKYIGWNVAPGGQIPPDITDNAETKQKISATLKQRIAKGEVKPPYKSNLHSPGAIAKRRHTAKESRRKWIHNPTSGEAKQLRVGFGETLPYGWEWGKKPRSDIKNREYRIKLGIETKKCRNKDYMCNAKTWNVTTPDGETHIVSSLKTWCRENGYKFYDVYNSKNGWKVMKI